MFGDEDENTKSLPNSLLIGIIDPEIEKNQIIKKISEKVEASFSQRLKFLTYKSINNLPSKKVEDKDNNNEKGIININWLNDISNSKISVCLLYYYFTFTTDIKSEEDKIISNIDKLKKADELINILVFIIFNNSNYQFDFERCRKYNIRNENFYKLNSINEINQNDIRKLSTEILKFSRDYYKKLKTKYKNRIESVLISDEEKTKYNIKIGIISLIKSKKNVNLNSKYFKIAYEYIRKILLEKVQNYHYGKPETKKLNYLEIKSNADWIFYKILKLTSDTVSQKDQIEFYNSHIENFSNFEYYDKKDVFIFFEYYWLYQRTKDFVTFISKNYYHKVLDENFIGNISLKCLYYLNNAIDFFKNNFENLNLGKINIGNKEISFDKIKKEKSKYYGKVPLYKYQFDPLTLKKIGFNDLCYVKKYLIEKNITCDKLIKEIYENISNQTMNYYDELKVFDVSNINLYLLILKYFNAQKYLDDENVYIQLQNIYNMIKKIRSINKFPKVILFFLSKFSHFLIKKQSSSSLSINEKKYLFEILIKLGNFRNLSEEEEIILSHLINDSEFTNFKNLEEENQNNTLHKDKHILFINSRKNIHNSILNFEYSIKDLNKDQSKEFLELIDFNFKITTSLKKEKIKFTSLNLVFEIENKKENIYDIRNVPIERLSDELSEENPLTFQYKFLVKLYDTKIFLQKIIFTLEKTPFYLFENYLSHSNHNIIFLHKFSKNILEFIYPSSVTLGLNEYYNFDFSLKTDPTFNIEIKNLIFEFSYNKSINENNNSNNLDTSTKSFVLTSKKNYDYMKFFGTAPLQSQVFKKQSFIPLQEPEIYLYDENDKNINQIPKGNKILIPNLESIIKEGKKSPIIMRFKEEGNYKISLKTTYVIIKKELTNDSLNYIETKNIDFTIIQPFNFKYDISCNNYLSKLGKKEFPIGKNIKLDLIIINQLNSKRIIEDIKEEFFDKYKNIINTKSSLLNLIKIKDLDNEIKESLFTILKSSEHTIPIDCTFSDECEESIGNLKLIYSSENLKSFSTQNNYNIYNEFNFPFPDDISIKNFDLDLNYNYSINQGLILLKINIKNKNSLAKKIMFIIDKSDNFYISGINKQYYIIQGNEKMILEFKLIPTQIGNVKLPAFKVTEFPLNKQNDKLHSLYYFPNYISIE